MGTFTRHWLTSDTARTAYTASSKKQNNPYLPTRQVVIAENPASFPTSGISPGDIGVSLSDNSLYIVSSGLTFAPISSSGGGGGGGIHHTSHENGGSDEITVAGLSGLLADPQTPTTHAHAQSDITNLTTDLSGKAAISHGHTESEIVNLVTDLAGKAPVSHSHTESDITNLVTDLAGKAAATHTHAESDITNLVTDLAGKAAATHTHAESEITNLVTDLAGKAATSHTHAQSDITSLVTDLAGKAATSHAHAAVDISSGTIGTARLGSGTADSTVFLRGDQTWASPASGGLTQPQIMARSLGC